MAKVRLDMDADEALGFAAEIRRFAREVKGRGGIYWVVRTNKAGSEVEIEIRTPYTPKG